MDTRDRNMKRTHTGASDNKPSKGECRYKEQCYRKNPMHFEEYSHKHLTDIINNSNGSDFNIPPNLLAARDIVEAQLQILIDYNILPIKKNGGTNQTPTRIIENNDESSRASTSKADDSEIPNNARISIDVASIVKQELDKFFGEEDEKDNCVKESKEDKKKYDKRTNSFRDPEDTHDRHSTPSHHGKTIPNDYFSVMAPQGQFAAKLEAAAPYNFFLTTVAAKPITHGEPLSVTFTELLDKSLGELESSVQINFMVDIGWVLAHYAVSGNLHTPLLVLYGEEDPDLQEIKRKVSSVTAVHVRMGSPFGKHHTKMSLLGYKDGSMRVVISTANLYEPDWENRTQGLWISPKLPGIDTVWDTRIGESETGFRDDLLRYLISYKIPELQSWITRIRKTDFSSINVFLIPSIPGGHRGLEQARYGHTRLGALLSKYVTAKAADTVIAQSSSIGSLGPTSDSWAGGEFLSSAARGLHSGLPRSAPPFRMIYPSLANVQASHDGLLGGGCLPYSAKVHSKQMWLMDILQQWRAKSRHRSQAMPHIKSYCRVSGSLRAPSGLHWFVLTSANLSKAAWGAMNKTCKLDPPLRIMSYEAGVLFLPKFVLGTELLPLESTPDGPPAFPLPYDLPLTPYNPDDSPFFMDIFSQ